MIGKYLAFFIFFFFLLVGCDHLDPSAHKEKVSPSPETQTGPQTTHVPIPSNIEPGKTAKLSGLEYVVLPESNLLVSDSSLSGSGSILFVEKLKNPANHNFGLTIQWQPGGSVALLVGTDSSLQDGVVLTLSRKQEDRLGVRLERGTESTDLSPGFLEFATSASLNFLIDIHEHGHLIFWVEGKSMEDEYAFFPALKYKSWGLRLNKATVTQVQFKNALVEG